MKSSPRQGSPLIDVSTKEDLLPPKVRSGTRVLIQDSISPIIIFLMCFYRVNKELIMAKLSEGNPPVCARRSLAVLPRFLLRPVILMRSRPAAARVPALGCITYTRDSRLSPSYAGTPRPPCRVPGTKCQTSLHPYNKSGTSPLFETSSLHVL